MISTQLQDRILARIAQQGPLTFAEYMRMALYEPDYGYYVTGPARMGWEGDYYTSTDVSDFFANCMGRQLRTLWEQLDKPQHFNVLEQGAGRGDLARGVRKWAEQEAQGFNQALDYRIADINVGLDALKTDKKNHSSGQFSPSVILSNELVDAFPVHIVQKEQNKLHEVYIDSSGRHLHEVLREPENNEVATYLDTYKIPWHTYADGWRAEINLDALQWIEQTSRLLFGPNLKKKHRGFILAIDYGDTARNLYTAYRQQGTLTSYYQHQMTDQPLLKPGEQDITAHVNFTALIQAGRKQGLRLQTLTTQREWLDAMGIYTELEQLRQRDFAVIDQDRASDRGQVAMFQWMNLRQRVSALTDPHGMGAFKILILKR